MKLLKISFIIGLLMFNYNAVATNMEKQEGIVQEKESKISKTTVEIPVLFEGQDPNSPVTVNWNDLQANLRFLPENKNEKARLLSLSMSDLPYRNHLQLFPDESVTFHGITVKDLSLKEGEEYYPTTLMTLLKNKENDKQFRVTSYWEHSSVRIESFEALEEQYKTQSDYRGENLYKILQEAGILNFVKDKNRFTSLQIPFLQGSDLTYSYLEDGKVIKLQHFFGMNLEQTDRYRQIHMLYSEAEQTFSSKKDMKEYFQTVVLPKAREKLDLGDKLLSQLSELQEGEKNLRKEVSTLTEENEKEKTTNLSLSDEIKKITTQISETTQQNEEINQNLIIALQKIADLEKTNEEKVSSLKSIQEVEESVLIQMTQLMQTLSNNKQKF